MICINHHNAQVSLKLSASTSWRIHRPGTVPQWQERCGELWGQGHCRVPAAPPVCRSDPALSTLGLYHPSPNLNHIKIFIHTVTPISKSLVNLVEYVHLEPGLDDICGEDDGPECDPRHTPGHYSPQRANVILALSWSCQQSSRGLLF